MLSKITEELPNVWLAAKSEKKLKKSQISETELRKSVQKIIKDGKNLNFQIQAQLLIGIVRIYAKKMNYLSADCNDAMKSSFNRLERKMLETLPTKSKQKIATNLQDQASLDAMYELPNFTYQELQENLANDNLEDIDLNKLEAKPEDLIMNQPLLETQPKESNDLDMMDENDGTFDVENFLANLEEDAGSFLGGMDLAELIDSVSGMIEDDDEEDEEVPPPAEDVPVPVVEEPEMMAMEDPPEMMAMEDPPEMMAMEDPPEMMAVEEPPEMMAVEEPVADVSGMNEDLYGQVDGNESNMVDNEPAFKDNEAEEEEDLDATLDNDDQFAEPQMNLPPPPMQNVPHEYNNEHNSIPPPLATFSHEMHNNIEEERVVTDPYDIDGIDDQRPFMDDQLPENNTQPLLPPMADRSEPPQLQQQPLQHHQNIATPPVTAVEPTFMEADTEEVVYHAQDMNVNIITPEKPVREKVNIYSRHSSDIVRPGDAEYDDDNFLGDDIQDAGALGLAKDDEDWVEPEYERRVRYQYENIAEQEVSDDFDEEEEWVEKSSYQSRRPKKRKQKKRKRKIKRKKGFRDEIMELTSEWIRDGITNTSDTKYHKRPSAVLTKRPTQLHDRTKESMNSLIETPFGYGWAPQLLDMFREKVWTKAPSWHQYVKNRRQSEHNTYDMRTEAPSYHNDDDYQDAEMDDYSEDEPPRKKMKYDHARPLEVQGREDYIDPEPQQQQQQPPPFEEAPAFTAVNSVTPVAQNISEEPSTAEYGEPLINPEPEPEIQEPEPEPEPEVVDDEGDVISGHEEDVVEDIDDDVEEITETLRNATIEGFTHKTVQTLQFLASQDDSNLSFDQLTEGQSCKVAAGLFYELLVIRSKGLVQLEQKEDYGDTTIIKNKDFDEFCAQSAIDF